MPFSMRMTLRSAARSCVFAIFAGQGQICAAGSRLLLLILFHKNPEDDFIIPEKYWKKLSDELRPTACGESQVHMQYAGLTEGCQQAEAALEVARHVRAPQHRELLDEHPVSGNRMR